MSFIKKSEQGLRKTLDKVCLIERYICCCLLVVMTFITFAQVFCRFVLRNPFSWSEEVTLVLLVWFGYLCMPIDIYNDGHAALFAFYNKFPAALKKTFDIIRHVILLWFFIELTHYGLILSKLNARKIQPATGMSYMWLYIPLVVGGILMAIYCISNLLLTCVTSVQEYKDRDNKSKSFDEEVKKRIEEKGGVL